MSIKNEIKSYLELAGWTQTDIAEELSKKYNKNVTIQNLNNKIAKGTLRYKEALDIADIAGYKVEWIKKDPGN